MRQLVELKPNSAKFDELNAKVIAIFREESSGQDGLKKIQAKTNTPFTIAIDTPASQTKAYSFGKMEFDNYVIDSNGKIAAVIDGTLKTRAKAEQFVSVLSKLKTEAGKQSQASNEDPKSAIRRAILDYVEGVYEMKPDLIRRSVHPELKKFGFWRPQTDSKHRAGSEMTFDELIRIAETYAKNVEIPENAPKEIEIFDVMEKMAVAKLTATWGSDYFQLVNEEGRWMIRHIVWQSPSAEK